MRDERVTSQQLGADLQRRSARAHYSLAHRSRLAGWGRTAHIGRMSLPGKLLLVLAVVCAACSRSMSDLLGRKEAAAPSTISLRADYLDVSGRSINLVAGDSLILKATVEGEPDAYQLPVITATNPSALLNRADGTAAVRIPVFLDLTATALPKAAFANRPTLTTTAKLSLACTAVGDPAIWVSLRDASTGAAPTGPGNVKIRVTSDAFADSISGPIGDIGWGTGEGRVGTFTVAVDADGYLPWKQDGIVVTRGLCRVIGAKIIATLVRRQSTAE